MDRSKVGVFPYSLQQIIFPTFLLDNSACFLRQSPNLLMTRLQTPTLVKLLWMRLIYLRFLHYTVSTSKLKEIYISLQTNSKHPCGYAQGHAVRVNLSINASWSK